MWVQKWKRRRQQTHRGVRNPQHKKIFDTEKNQGSRDGSSRTRSLVLSCADISARMAGVWHCMLMVAALVFVCLLGSTDAVGEARSRPRPQRRPKKVPKVEPIDITPPVQNVDIRQVRNWRKRQSHRGYTTMCGCKATAQACESIVCTFECANLTWSHFDNFCNSSSMCRYSIFGNWHVFTSLYHTVTIEQQIGLTDSYYWFDYWPKTDATVFFLI